MSLSTTEFPAGPDDTEVRSTKVAGLLVGHSTSYSTPAHSLLNEGMQQYLAPMRDHTSRRTAWSGVFLPARCRAYYFSYSWSTQRYFL